MTGLTLVWSDGQKYLEPATEPKVGDILLVGDKDNAKVILRVNNVTLFSDMVDEIYVAKCDLLYEDEKKEEKNMEENGSIKQRIFNIVGATIAWIAVIFLVSEPEILTWGAFFIKVASLLVLIISYRIVTSGGKFDKKDED